MEDKILKQIESEAFRRFPVELTRDKVDENSYRRKVFTENCEWYHNNIKESVDEKMSKNIEIVLPSATSACKYDIQVKSMVGEVLFEHTFYGNSKPLIKESVDKKLDELLPAVENIIYRSLQDLLTDSNTERSDCAAIEVIDYLKLHLSASKNTVSNEFEIFKAQQKQE